MTPPTENILVPAPIKLLIHTLIIILVTFEAIAVTGCDNSTMKNTEPIVNQSSNVSSNLPPNVVKAVLEDLSQKAEIPIGKLTITEAKKELWSNGCLDLAREGEFCTQAMVPGWRVFVLGEGQTWVYRTDARGTSLRGCLESQKNCNN